MSNKVWKTEREKVFRLLEYFNHNTDKMWKWLDDNNHLEYKEKTLSKNQSMVLESFPKNGKVKLQDLWNDFCDKNPDVSLSRSGHYRIVSQLNRKGYIIKTSGGWYQRYKKLDDIINPFSIL